ncbi:synaptic vesicle 2-related protein-like [Pecten maximus]|uniref:synaptic vesicle 2-related protein-like n=1 Tax=Pecten maximus TaxID=6579 RepID=UPI00145838BA|nr:synaptic vesicle 2-related protein-like [Pecten maximus]
MFSRLVKYTKGDAYQDLDASQGERIDMDITDPAMREFAGLTPTGSSSGEFSHVGEGGILDMHQRRGTGSTIEPSEETYTIQQAIDNIGFGKFQIKLSILTGFAWMADAMEMMILAILSPALHCEWQLESWQQALITTIVFCGMFCSSSFWGSVCDKYGRRSELILCSVFTCYFGILSAFSPTFIWMLILRGLVGFGIGGAPQSVTLYAEFLPSSSRARCVVLVEIFWAIGACLGELGNLNEGATNRGSIKDLFIPELRKTTILLWVIWFVSAFSYYGIVLMTTELFEISDGCHGSEIKAKAPCFLKCNGLNTGDYIDLTWTTFAEFPGLFVTVVVIEKIGRKFTMAMEFFVFTVFVLFSNICTSRPVLTFFLFVARAFISGAFQAAYVYTPEVYPTSMRAIGLGCCSAMARVGAIITPFIAQVLLRSSSYTAISTYGVIALVATGVSVLLPIETKGREMKDTSHEVQNTSSK